MYLRELQEEYENTQLAPEAAKSSGATRPQPMAKCDMRTAFQRDVGRILHSKSFRRLKHKTQVFLSPEGDHYRTRMTHTLEVAQVARTISRALRLNEDLTEAIALGHDIGHTPFGHCGERVLNSLCEDGFRHNEQSKRAVVFLEKDKYGKRGLNLTDQTVDGILHHSGAGWPSTMEGVVVRYADRIAYIHHDIDDSIRAGVLAEEDIPASARRIAGETNKERIDFFIHDFVRNVLADPHVGFSREVAAVFNDIRDFMFEHVYLNKVAKKEEGKAEHVVKALYQYYLDHPEQMPEDRYGDYKGGEGYRAVKDYLASMSDRYAIAKYQTIFIPSFWF